MLEPLSGLWLLLGASSSTSESDDDESQRRPAVVEGVRSFFGFLVLTLPEVEEDEAAAAAAAAAASFFALFAAVAMAVLGSLGVSSTTGLEGDVSVALGVVTREEVEVVGVALSFGLDLATGEGTVEVEREDGLGALDRGSPEGLEHDGEDPEEVGLGLVRGEEPLLVGRGAGRRGGGMANPEGDRRV